MKQLIKVYQQLQEEKWSGELQITASEGYATVVLANGKLFYAHRPFDRALESFQTASWLKLPPEELSKQIRDWDEFIHLLVKQNSKRVDRLKRYLKTDRDELFYRSFFWTNLELFPRPYTVNQEDFPNLEFYGLRHLDKMLAEAARRIAEWPSIQQQIGSGKRVFVTRVAPPENSTGSQKSYTDEIDRALINFETTGMRLSGLDLGPYNEPDAFIIRLCDGTTTIGQVIRLSEESEYLTLKRILQLWETGIILPRDEEMKGASSAERARRRLNALDWRSLALFPGFVLVLCFALNLFKTLNVELQDYHLRKAIEVYRLQKGRYPITLRELMDSGLIHAHKFPKSYEYQIINLNSFTLKEKDHQ